MKRFVLRVGGIFAPAACTLAVLGILSLPQPLRAQGPTWDTLAEGYAKEIRPLLMNYCARCHGADRQEGELNLEGFAKFADVRKASRAWQKVLEMLETDQMPPPKAKQLNAGERAGLRLWVRNYLKMEARSGAGDPGRVVLRRLSNAEYTYTVRDLTGLESLQPAREFPVDGAAGEGFTNTGDALAMSPALFTKYLDAAKLIVGHAVMLPDGLRFSPHSTRRDWTNELLEQIRTFYGRYSDSSASTRVNLQGLVWDTKQGGRLPVEKYLAATLVERDSLTSGRKTLATVAHERGLSAKYLGLVWQSLNDRAPSLLLDDLRVRWRTAKPEDAAALAVDISKWQKTLWTFNSVGHIGKLGGPKAWMEPALPLDARFDSFRDLFPPAVSYTKVVPVDEVVTLTLFFREDHHLIRLMLEDGERRQLDRLWDELDYVSQSALSQVDAFAQLLEYASQDGDPKLFEPLRKPIQDRADAFRKRLVATQPRHLEGVLEFASRAYRRPLAQKEKDDLAALYQNLRKQSLSHEEAVRLALARVLVAPAFLYRLEKPGPGTGPVPVSDWELASRLSYFLWSSVPDAELTARATTGKLREGIVPQMRRMLRDSRVRRLATEFGCQWLHIRGFDEMNEKSEQVFPTFAALRDAMYEESILFFTDLFQEDRSVLEILDADYTFVNDALAEHYGMPGVTGKHWRRIDGVKKYDRGGVLAQATTLATQSGASRTSPILRGNWVSEVLLGEKLPRPPKGVPQLPGDETKTEGFTIRQLIEKHSSDANCAVCHRRIDAYGFALEGFDAIGRRRDTDLGDRPIDTRAQTIDGAEFVGLSGLRDYLLSKRKDAFVRQFCRKLLGYALARGVQLTDEPLLDDIEAKLKANGYRITVALEAIVGSQQFREIRGSKFMAEE